MMGNYSVLTQNTLDGLTDGAQSLYLELLDKFEGHTNRAGERRAFALTMQYEAGIGLLLNHILCNGPVGLNGIVDEKTRIDVEQFISARWRHNFMPAIAVALAGAGQ